MIDYIQKDAEEAQRTIGEIGLSCQQESLEAVVARRQLQHERREAPRFGITRGLTATIFVVTEGNSVGASEKVRLVREGFTNDISLSGACIVLKNKLTRFTIDQLVGKKIKLQLDLSNDTVKPVPILGLIVWGKETDQQPTLGIQFTVVLESDRAILSSHCLQDSGELSTLSDLWEALVAQKNETRGSESQ